MSGTSGTIINFGRTPLDLKAKIPTITRKMYVDFLFVGSFFVDEGAQVTETRDVSKIVVPEGAFGFVFFDVFSTEIDDGGHKVRLTSERVNRSPIHYYGGRVYTLEDIQRDFPKERALIRNIKSYKSKAIRCRTGNWQLFDEKTDVLVEEVAV